ncbi:exo-beta-N-acetylmuramidase NamZ domain-containing protein [Pontibacter ruber]|uniref:Exo-beta-N-acetylmuramidase NamZ domain-containing protein n=1 Tax=Pontibacter ruber TaxID=1343895 RepID=A0ABW5D113_9BACT|nr:exo-beta-N-acetylmuramidase NamZ domain-containing protein [Pontibacter ruber]
MKRSPLLLLLWLALCFSSCTRQVVSTATPPAAVPSTNRVVIGAERLFTPEFLPLIQNKRIGLVTNHTGLLPDGRHLVDVLHERKDTKLTVLFGPEHGIRGDADTHVADGTDSKTGLPIVSLYGKVRKPTPEMLQNVDVLIFDIQDVGARFYTYIATMNHVLEAAAEQGKPYIILDRPNAIGGQYVDGPVGEKANEPVTGVAQLPVVHGMTVGELATMFNTERASRKLPQAQLTVVPMLHYKRQLWYDQTNLPWVKPSPNMLTLTTATVYPATCLLEGTNISEARGTLHPFERIAATWMDGEKLTQQLNSYGMAGVTFRPVAFVPDSVVDGIRIYPPKFVGQQCQGTEMVVTDRNAFESAKAGVYILHALQTLYPKKLEWRDSRMDKLWGTPEVRKSLQAGLSPQQILSQWEDQLAYFRNVRSKYLLY